MIAVSVAGRTARAARRDFGSIISGRPWRRVGSCLSLDPNVRERQGRADRGDCLDGRVRIRKRTFEGHGADGESRPNAVIASHANEVATVGGKVQPALLILAMAFVAAVDVPVHVPLSGRTMEFDGDADCVSGR